MAITVTDPLRSELYNIDLMLEMSPGEPGLWKRKAQIHEELNETNKKVASLQKWAQIMSNNLDAVIWCGACLKSPEEVQAYFIDFKSRLDSYIENPGNQLEYFLNKA